MKTMKKFVAILAVALLLCSMLPLSVMAADENVADLDTITKTNTSYVTSTTTNGWTAVNAAVLSGGSSNSSPKFSFIDSSESTRAVCLNGKTTAKGKLTSPTLSGGISKLTFNYGLPFSDTKIGLLITITGVDGTVATKTVSNASATKTTKYDFEWELDTPITGDFTIVIENTSPSNNTGNKDRTAIWNIAWVGGNTDCDHDSLKCEETCSVCNAFTKEHEWDDCNDTQCNACSETRDAVEHTYSSNIDPKCDVCNASRVIAPELIVDAAYALGNNAALADTYTLSGVITSVDSAYDASYKNVTVTITVFDSNGEAKDLQCYRMSGEGADVIKVGDTITVSGIIKNYNGKVEFDAGCELISYEAGECLHDYNYDCDKVCKLCGLETRPDAECESDADYPCQEGACNYCGNTIVALDHVYDDQWDADCNYGCGYTREVEEKPEMTEATLDFSTTTQRTEYSNSVQKWENSTLVLTNNKGGSGSNVGNYFNPARFYKGSEIIIAFPGMTSLVIVAPTNNDGQYSTPWAATLDAANLSYTEADGVYTVTFAEPVDSITLTTTAQIRANSITAYAAKQSGDEDCEHSWNAATCTEPATCALCGATDGEALGHNYVEDIIDATCTKTGTATYECSVCFDSYDEEIPMIPHNYVDGTCSACGAEKPAGYAPITSADQLVSGQYILVVNTGHAPSYFENGWVLPSQPVITDGLILDPTGYLWTLTVDGATVKIQDINGAYIAPKGGNNNGIISSEYAWAWSFENGVFTFAGTGDDTVLFACNTDATNGQNRFRGYKTSTLTGNTASLYRSEFTLYAASTSAPEEPECEHEYFYPCDPVCMKCYEITNPDAAHSVKHVEAVAPTCTALGNVEYWYCEYCGSAWADEAQTQMTNQMSVKLPMAEHEYFYPCDPVCMNCYEITNPDAAHTIVAVEAVAATCAANGNIAYWYCSDCGSAWADEAQTQMTNQRNVIIPATGEHTYDDEYDADCNVCGDVREVPEKPVEIVYGDANGDGIVDLKDVALLQQVTAGYDVTLDEIAADANGDGIVDLKDVALLQQVTAGYDVVLGPVNKGPLFNDAELGW